ncbi:hypothetical protein [Paraburkholderia sp. CI3]|uniref:hypothetical protein n=1 Tax=Paraburkholderia sp. CI3 TaxID=2991060 RepID=UPI003D2009F5
MKYPQWKFAREVALAKCPLLPPILSVFLLLGPVVDAGGPATLHFDAQDLAAAARCVASICLIFHFSIFSREY